MSTDLTDQHNGVQTTNGPASKDYNPAVDYMKNKYETGGGSHGGQTLPNSFREPRKLDMNWDKVVDEKKPNSAAGAAGMDIMSCLNVQVSESRAQFECFSPNGTNSERSSGCGSPLPVNRQPIEKVAAPETRNLRAMFESGQVTDRHQIQRTSPMADIPADSGVYENQPSPLNIEGLVRSGDIAENTGVEKGYTKNLLSQWKTKGTEEFKSERKPINIAEDEGRVLENEPVKRTDVVNYEYKEEGSEVQRGYTKNLLNQWKTKGTEEFKSERKPIKLAEDEGRILENEPVKRTDVVNAEYVPPETEVQKGYTKNLLSQWQTKGSEEYRSERKPISVAEDEGRVLENEPVKRTDVVNSEELPSEVLYEKGYAKNMLNQWKTKGTEEFRSERKPIKIAEDEGKVLENEPMKRTDVVNAEANSEEKLYERGYAKNMLNQWTTKGSEKFKSERKPINIAEDEGKVLENQPIKRTDVVNAEQNLEEPLYEKGYTKNMLNQWNTKGNEEFRCERKPINIAEDEGKVLENEPIRRTDVVNADQSFEEISVQKGTTRNLLNQWVTKGSEEYKSERKAIVLAEDEGRVVENEPERPRDDVVREQYEGHPNDLPTSGQARLLKEQWATRKNEFQKTPKVIKLVEDDRNEPSVVENEPMQRSDVVREEDNSEELWMHQGYTKNLAGYWTAPKDNFQVERKPINLHEGTDVSAPAVYENNPERLEGVVRGDLNEEEVLAIERGRARNMASMWQNREDVPVTSRWKLDIDPNSGTVLENEPEVRQDVYREDGSAEEAISVREARNMREVWKKKETEEDMRPAILPQQVRFTPPREMSPTRNEFKSVQTLTLSNAGQTPTLSNDGQMNDASFSYYNGSQH